MRLSMKLDEEPKAFRFAELFYDSINTSALLAYKSIFGKQEDLPREIVLKNVKELLRNLGDGVAEPNESKRGAEKEKLSLEQKLTTLGEYFIQTEKISDISGSKLWRAALQYDLKGIVPQHEESLEDFVFRGNTTLYVHKQLRKPSEYGIRELYIDIDKETSDVKLKLRLEGGSIISEEDLKEANKRIPYYMDLSWVTGYVKRPEDLIIPALGLTFTLPQYNGLSFIQMCDRYKSRKFYLEVLSHEMVHAGTVFLDNPQRREFIETKAYAVGRGSFMGEYAVAVNSRPNILLKAAQMAIQFFLPGVPDSLFKYAPKVKGAIQIAVTTGMYNQVKEGLVKLYGHQGNYILGRLTADEMDEFRYTNDIPARINMKNNLKWQIMKENFASLV